MCRRSRPFLDSLAVAFPTPPNFAETFEWLQFAYRKASVLQVRASGVL